MLPNLNPDMALAARLFDALREATRDGEGVTREAYGRGERIAHQLVRDAAEELGLECRNDVAGNLYMTLPGADRAAKRIIMGSHLDSVREGGNFDGAAHIYNIINKAVGVKGVGACFDIIINETECAGL
jgi:N-carbamoyl-L-amino-acid hydrolase